MKKTMQFLSCFAVVVLGLSSSATALFTPVSHLQGTLDYTTRMLTIGHTRITGSFSGYPIRTLIDSPLVQDMSAFPLIGENRIPAVDNVIVVENIDITTVSSITELLTNYPDHVHTYSQVDILTENGVYVLAFTKGTLSVSSDLPYAATSQIMYPIVENVSAPFFLTATTSAMTLQYTGDLAVLAQLSSTSTITLADSEGAILWSGSSETNYIIIQDTRFSVTQAPPLFFFPLTTEGSQDSLHLILFPSDQTNINVKQLLIDISATPTQTGDVNISQVLVQIQGFDDNLATASAVANGAIVLLQTHDTVIIDGTPQTFSDRGFLRFTSMEVTYTDLASGPTLQGDCKLIFLGDHLYTAQATHSNGIVFSIVLLVLWIVALLLFFFIQFIKRPPLRRHEHTELKYHILLFHIVMIIITFVLIDFEVNDRIGASAGGVLATQGVSLIFGGFLLFELVLWVLGFLLLALPLQLLIHSLFRYLGLGTYTNGIRKGISDIFIWVFCILYLYLIINIMIAPFHLSSLFPMG